MTVLIDPPVWPAHGTVWSHLVSDEGYDELHAFARRLGIPRRSFDLDHYDVPARLHARAISLGAVPVTGKEVVAALRAAGLRVTQAQRAEVSPVRRRQFLVAEWDELGGRLLVAGPGARRPRDDEWHRLGAALIARWNEPHRGYHDERHLEDVLLALDHLAVRGERVQEETLLAAWFHDTVYAGAGAGEDEDASARLAVAELGGPGLGLDGALVARVGAHIEATAPAREIDEAAPALAQLLDADLAIFASPAARYAEYARAVRGEYAHVPDPEFAAGRSAILRRYLDRAAIYRTGSARELWEDRARANVAEELGRLSG